MNKTLEIYQRLLTEIELQKRPYDLNKVISREYRCLNGINLLYSISIKEKSRIFSIPVNITNTEVTFPIWEGVKINFVKAREYASDTQLFISLQQNPDMDGDVFSIVVEDLRSKLEFLKNTRQTFFAVSKILKKWREFFTTGRNLILSGQETRGLFGELLFLKELISKSNTPSCVRFWEGEMATHDYYIGQNAVEIKTCLMQSPYKFHVNSVHQLDDKEVNGRLFLRFYAFRKDHNGGTTLPEIIDEIRKMLSRDVGVLEYFNAKIERIGYIDAAADFYHEGYTIRETDSFEIKSGFPRITIENIPIGVSNIEYDLSIGSCMDFVISTDELFKGVGF